MRQRAQRRLIYHRRDGERASEKHMAMASSDKKRRRPWPRSGFSRVFAAASFVRTFGMVDASAVAEVKR